ncbi:MAG: DUF2793 domain-containing protein [Pseudomonadota bacterium]
MSSTTNFGLPLVQAAQAQKHVTVNEALIRLDALAQLTLASRTVMAPPATPLEGAVYAVPTGAVGAWAEAEGRLALFIGGGWDFVDPRLGWRAWVADEGGPVRYDGDDWIGGMGSLSANAASMSFHVLEIDHVLGTGTSSDTAQVIPSHAMVFGVTGLVLSPIGGTATSWRLGIAGVSDDRYGSGVGLEAGAWLKGLTAQPVTYYSDTALTLTGEGGDLDGGVVRLAVHLAELGLPSP